MAWRRYWNYFKYVVRHKVGVYICGRRLGLGVLRLLLHDWDKFMPGMFIAYACTFYDENGEGQYVKHEYFDYWWLRHQQRNKHHYQNMVLLNDDGSTRPLQMKNVDVREMVADWMGVAYAKGDTQFPAKATSEWYNRTKDTKRFNPSTRAMVEIILNREVQKEIANG